LWTAFSILHGTILAMTIFTSGGCLFFDIVVGWGMGAGDAYRVKAAEISAKARGEANTPWRLELENLALSYLRLADQADRNAQVDLVYETPPAPPAPEHRPVAQQQQQPQPPPPASDDDPATS
jgi:hypothetical protein